MIKESSSFQKQLVIDHLYKHVEFLSVAVTGLLELARVNKSISNKKTLANRNYHQETDIIDTLNFEKMAEVVKGLHITILDF